MQTNISNCLVPFDKWNCLPSYKLDCLYKKITEQKCILGCVWISFGTVCKAGWTFVHMWCVLLHVCVAHIVIVLVHNAGQSHHSFSEGQRWNIQFANCLLLNMLHQSGLIMTLFQHSALLHQMRLGERGRQMENQDDEALQHKIQIQMQVLMRAA